MEEKINVAELLKDCPKGMELDSTTYDGTVRFEKLYEETQYPIKISVEYGSRLYFHTLTKYGESAITPYNKCIIFPKGKTSWNGFVPPYQFKDGDIVTCSHEGNYSWTCILKETPEKVSDNYFISDYCSLDSDDTFLPYDSGADSATLIRLATEEEKQRLFKVIKDYGYEWNAETKTLEKVKPQYPKTYIECATMINHYNTTYIDGYKYTALEALQTLLVCRDAYWKIAGNWKYDVNKTEEYFYIVNKCGRIVKEHYMLLNHILAFPTEELRDAFFENFKYLIEVCKELI